MAKHRKKKIRINQPNGPHKVNDMRKISSSELEAIESDKLSFAMCLSALIAKVGREVAEGTFEFIFYIEDFERVSDARMNLANAVFAERAGTKVTVVLKGGEIQVGQEEAQP